MEYILIGITAVTTVGFTLLYFQINDISSHLNELENKLAKCTVSVKQMEKSQSDADSFIKISPKRRTSEPLLRRIKQPTALEGAILGRTQIRTFDPNESFIETELANYKATLSNQTVENQDKLNIASNI